MIESPDGRSSESDGWPAFRIGAYSFKPAQTPEEIDQIQRLLYRTFVRELREYQDSCTGSHVDKFHHKNRYVVAVRDDRVCGMIAVHDQPPFSAGDALPDKAILEKLRPKLLETRLLAVEPQERQGLVFAGLTWAVYQYAFRSGYRYVLISALQERLKMYARMGFRPLAEAVRRGDAHFIPMLADLEELPEQVRRDLDGFTARMRR